MPCLPAPSAWKIDISQTRFLVKAERWISLSMSWNHRLPSTSYEEIKSIPPRTCKVRIRNLRWRYGLPDSGNNNLVVFVPQRTRGSDRPRIDRASEAALGRSPYSNAKRFLVPNRYLIMVFRPLGESLVFDLVGCSCSGNITRCMGRKNDWIGWDSSWLAEIVRCILPMVRHGRTKGFAPEMFYDQVVNG